MKARTSIWIPCKSHAEAKELALRLRADGHGAARRWKAVVACTETREQAEQLARKLELAVGPAPNFAVLGGAPL